MVDEGWRQNGKVEQSEETWPETSLDLIRPVQNPDNTAKGEEYNTIEGK